MQITLDLTSWHLPLLLTLLYLVVAGGIIVRHYGRAKEWGVSLLYFFGAVVGAGVATIVTWLVWIILRK